MNCSSSLFKKKADHAVRVDLRLFFPLFQLPCWISFHSYCSLLHGSMHKERKKERKNERMSEWGKERDLQSRFVFRKSRRFSAGSLKMKPLIDQRLLQLLYTHEQIEKVSITSWLPRDEFCDIRTQYKINMKKAVTTSVETAIYRLENFVFVWEVHEASTIFHLWL